MNAIVTENRNQCIARKFAPVPVPVTTYFLDEYVNHINDVPILREAYAVKAWWSQATAQVMPDEILAGKLITWEPFSFHYGNGAHTDTYALEHYKEQLSDADRALFLEKMEQAEKASNKDAGFTLEEHYSIEARAASSTFFSGHMVPDYYKLLRIGIKGYMEEIQKYKNQGDPDFYKALELIAEALSILFQNHAKAAQAIGKTQMAEDLMFLSQNPPENFRQAVQMVWMVHYANNSDSFGRLDQYLYPFYQEDIKNGTLTEEEAYTLLCGLVIKVEEDGNIQNLTIGGTRPDGTPAENELTTLMLRATKDMGFKGPNLCMRVREDLSQNYWDEIMDLVSTGQGLPALYNDELIIKQLEDSGFSTEDARDFCLAGCSQIIIGGRSNFVNDIGILNVAKIMELTLRDGFDPKFGQQIGPHTGTDFETFDAFMDAFYQQTDYFCKLEADINNRYVDKLRHIDGFALRTLIVSDCIEKGKGVYFGGSEFNNVQLECIGITNAADSLYALKKAVFEDKKVTFKELVDALNRNFEGAEELRHYLSKLPKFGNDHEAVDSIRYEITDYTFRKMREQKGLAGGIYIPGEVIFVAHEDQGWAVGATPDGRLAGTVLADSAGARQGCDINGPTALISSVSKIPSSGIITSVVVNIKFMKSLFGENRDKIQALLQVYLQNGGEQLQINVCDNEILKKAMANPEEYRSLVIRVGGYSAYFVELSRALQEEIILRNATM